MRDKIDLDNNEYIIEFSADNYLFVQSQYNNQNTNNKILKLSGYSKNFKVNKNNKKKFFSTFL